MRFWRNLQSDFSRVLSADGKAISIAFFAMSILSYLVAMPMRSFCVRLSGCTLGITSLVFGWLDLLFFNFVWLANPLLFLGWLFFLLGAGEAAAFCSAAAFAFASYFLFMTKVQVFSEGGPSLIEQVMIGYWMWLISIATTFAASLVSYYSKKLTASIEAPSQK